MKAYKPAASHIFHLALYFRSLGSKVQKVRVCAENHHQKLHLFVTDVLGIKTDLKFDSLHLEQFSRPYVGIELEFYLSLFSLDMLQPFPDSRYCVLARSCSNRSLGNSVVP